MAPAKPWALDDLLAEIVARWEATSMPVSAIVDEMAPIKLEPDSQERVIRAGLIHLANDHQGTRGFRSGKVQSATTSLKPMQLHQDLIADREDRILARLRYQVEDGSQKAVADFTNADAKYLYGQQVIVPRAVAARVEPFWTALVEVTEDGRTLRQHNKRTRRTLARLAVSSGLTQDDKAEEDRGVQDIAAD